MKPTTLKHILAVSLLTIVALFIWFIGPQIAIGNHTPFAPPEQRFYVITALFLLWFLKFLFIDTAPKKTNFSATANTPDAIKKLDALKARFQGALDFLNKTGVQKQSSHTSLAALPWYLLIGPNNSGKTSLLVNSNINYILSKQFKPEQLAHIPSSDMCDWWVTRDSVLVDVPGFYLASPSKNTGEHLATILWRGLLNLIKTTPAIGQLNGAIVTLNFPELLKTQNHEHRNQAIQDLRKRIIDLRTVFGTQLPFYFVITKCDLLPGFSEFFSENSMEDLGHAWGVTLPVVHENEKLLDVFANRFNALIKRLNKQLLWRLHQERNPSARPYIKDFPLHVERLKETLSNFLKALAMPDLRLQGVYLTSAVQKNTEENTTYLYPASSTTNNQSLQIMRAPLMPSRPYFIKQVIAQGILQAFEHAPETQKPDNIMPQRAIYALSVAIITAAAVIMGHDFQLSVQKAYSIQNDLSHYQLYMQQASDDAGHLNKALPLLDALQQAAMNANRHASVLNKIISFYSNKSQRTANTVYHQALQTIVMPEIKNDLEKYLRTASTKNPEHVYTALKAYLMLANPQNRQASFIANTVNVVMLTKLNKQALTQLTSHIGAAFTHQAPAIVLDNNLIAQVRKQLVNLPSDDLAMLILKNYDNNNSDSSIELGTNTGNPPIFVSHAIANRIPNMFTSDGYQKIADAEINSAAAEAIKGNWVLGDVAGNPNQPTITALTTQLHNRYVSNYIDIWESLLANIHPNTPKNLLQTDAMVVSLTNNNSPLLHLLETIKQNTAFSPIINASPKLQALDNMLGSANNDRQSPLYQTFVNLRQLHSYMQTVLTATDLSQSAFDISSQRMQNSAHDPITEIHLLAAQSPEPMKTWLSNIANESWDFILQEAAQHVENAWQNKIIPTYNAEISNHYPFNPNAREEVNLVNFTRFLGHDGKLANFYMSYLKPFINDKTLPWSWRTVDNRKIPFSNTLLANLEHASLLQQAFFPYKDNKLSVQFILQPVALQPDVKSFSLNINGTQLYLQKNMTKSPKVLSWPGSYTTHGTSLNFTTVKNQSVGNTLKGDWAWFKLVNSATLNVNSRKELVLSFATNGHAAKYLLYTNGNVNPFLPMNLTKFELPQDLIE